MRARMLVTKSMGNVFPPPPNGDGIQRPHAPATLRTSAVAARWRPHHPQSGCEKIFCDGFCEDNRRFSISSVASASHLSRRDRRRGEVDEMDEEKKKGRDSPTPAPGWRQQKRHRDQVDEIVEEKEDEEMGEDVEAMRRQHRHVTKRHKGMILTSVAVDRARMEHETKVMQYPRMGLEKDGGGGEKVSSQTVKEKGEEEEEKEEEEKEEEEEEEEEEEDKEEEEEERGDKEGGGGVVKGVEESMQAHKLVVSEAWSTATEAMVKEDDKG